MPSFDQWGSFYGIVGSAAGTLIGLQFVVMTFINERPPVRAAMKAHAAFGRPTIVHFCASLLLSALMRMPWHHVVSAAAVLEGLGLVGTCYALFVILRIRRQDVYTPDLEDWSFHAGLPLLAYAALAVAAPLTLGPYLPLALFGVGVATLLLLFIGIHNAWDAVSYHVMVYRPRIDAETQQAGQASASAPASTAE